MVKLKRSVTIINNKNCLDKLPNELSNDLRLFQEKLKNACDYGLVPRLRLKKKILLILVKKYFLEISYRRYLLSSLNDSYTPSLQERRTEGHIMTMVLDTLKSKLVHYGLRHDEWFIMDYAIMIGSLWSTP